MVFSHHASRIAWRHRSPAHVALSDRDSSRAVERKGTTCPGERDQTSTADRSCRDCDQQWGCRDSGYAKGAHKASDVRLLLEEPNGRRVRTVSLRERNIVGEVPPPSNESRLSCGAA